MDKEQLQKTLEELHEELSTIDSIDGSSRALLDQLMVDIQSVISKNKPEAEEQAYATAQLEAAAVKFKSEHPKLAMTLSEVVDTLGKLGI